MSIKGLTDQHAAFPRIGVLRKGAPRPEDGKRPGKDLEYFRFDSTDTAAVKAFATAYGAEPQRINVYLPYVTVEGNFQAWREEWVAGGLKHRCDGETMTQYLVDGGHYGTAPAPCPYANGTAQRTTANPGCKPVGRLMVIIPELKRLAYVQVQTTSIHDIIELQGNLEAAYALRGNLRGIPFVLRRQARAISMPDQTGKRVRRIKFLLYIEPSPDWVALQLQSMHFEALPTVPSAAMLTSAATMLALPDNGHIDTEDAGDLVEDGDFAEMDVEDVGTINLGTGEVRASEPEAVDPLIALWTAQAKNHAHAPLMVNGNWGALQAVLTGICGGREQRLAFYGALFGRVVTTGEELQAPERSWLHAYVKPFAAKDGGGWHANVKAEGEIVAFLQRHPMIPTPVAPDEVLTQAAADNPDSKYAPQQQEPA